MIKRSASVDMLRQSLQHDAVKYVMQSFILKNHLAQIESEVDKIELNYLGSICSMMGFSSNAQLSTTTLANFLTSTRPNKTERGLLIAHKHSKINQQRSHPELSTQSPKCRPVGHCKETKTYGSIVVFHKILWFKTSFEALSKFICDPSLI